MIKKILNTRLLAVTFCWYSCTPPLEGAGGPYSLFWHLPALSLPECDREASVVYVAPPATAQKEKTATGENIADTWTICSSGELLIAPVPLLFALAYLTLCSARYECRNPSAVCGKFSGDFLFFAFCVDCPPAPDFPGQKMATMNIQLSKQNVGEPWGFRLQGGQDFRQQLQIKKVRITYREQRSRRHGGKMYERL